MNTKFVLALNALLLSQDFGLRVANAADAAYNAGNGAPESHTPFTDDNSVQNNLPGFYGTVAAATAIAAMRFQTVDGRASAEGLEQAVRDMAENNLTDEERLVARACVNATWRQRNADRDLKRAARPINVVILAEGTEVADLEKEIAKDDYQFITAANEILAAIDAQS